MTHRRIQGVAIVVALFVAVLPVVATCPNPSTGPDVIVGDLSDVGNYGNVGSIYAYALGSVSCNVGNANLSWVSSTNQHPLIGQSLYRLKAGRFEQIGTSWLKHAFAAGAGNVCCTCTSGGGGLGPGCSDPYGSGLNASQGNLGPRSEVNAATGSYIYPYVLGSNPSTGDAIFKRIQVHAADLDPAQNAGARYFGEIQYINNDDALAHNNNNNLSYREATITNATTFAMGWAPGAITQRTRPAIQAWQDVDSAVQMVNVDIPGDGRLIVAWKVTNPSAGVYHYEYAIENLNSDRCVQAIDFPVQGAVLSNIGFHDLDYHSGEPYSLADWAASQLNGKITWATQTFAVNQNANALRWGTLYNVRFDATTAPISGNATLTLFKPGANPFVNFATQVPGPADCNNNGILDNLDIQAGTSQDCNSNLLPDECELATNDCNHNGLPDNCELAGHDCDGNGVHDSCQLVGNDTDANGVPDNCQADCDHDGQIDAYEIILGAEDCNANGVPDTCDVNVPSTTANPNTAIPDNNTTGITSVVIYSGSGNVTDVNVTVHIPHTGVGDLTLKLTHAGTTRTIWDNRCLTFDNLNCTFDDSGGFINCSLLTGGVFTPSSAGGQTLAAFNGLSAAGDWTLTAIDHIAANTGVLQSWTLNVTSTVPPAAPLPDVNHNNVPDSCECMACKGDANKDNVINGKDIAFVVRSLTGGPMNRCVDMDGNGVLNVGDLTQFVTVLIDPNPPCAQ